MSFLLFLEMALAARSHCFTTAYVYQLPLSRIYRLALTKNDVYYYILYNYIKDMESFN